MGTRYDDQIYLDTWKDTGEYPKIHTAVFDAAIDHHPEPSTDLTFLDLCCSTGLLGAHLREAGFSTVFADGDKKAIDRGIAAGTFSRDPLWFGDVTPGTINHLGQWMAENNVTDVMARRCLCVLSLKVELDVIGNVFADAGAERLTLEGQLISSRATAKNGAGEDQAAGLESSGRWKTVERVNKAIFYLEVV